MSGWYSVEMAKHIVKLFLPSDRHTILVFPYKTLWQYSNVAVECKGLWKKIVIFDLYLRNDTKYGQITVEDELATFPKILNGIIYNDLEWPLTHLLDICWMQVIWCCVMGSIYMWWCSIWWSFKWERVTTSHQRRLCSPGTAWPSSHQRRPPVSCSLDCLACYKLTVVSWHQLVVVLS